ncbi:hypothetical protein BDM02DRAFT_1744954 [Thelephora ganbajun]|uniref:Uncharacterized protein n=1 Tax=Thelephora ganbajun TaxID=370292 RepID=A0ACB6Z111_THEGA|nr:hypothetical protein BDM02DRAFT_1744954 [Thelephora ganbajun]
MVFLLGMTWLEIPFKPVGHILRGGVTEKSHRPLKPQFTDRRPRELRFEIDVRWNNE